jgi:hypothetical protein
LYAGITKLITGGSSIFIILFPVQRTEIYRI